MSTYPLMPGRSSDVHLSAHAGPLKLK